MTFLLNTCCGVCIFVGLLVTVIVAADYTSPDTSCNNQCGASVLLSGNDRMRMTVQTSDNDIGREYVLDTYLSQMTISLAMQNLRSNAASNFPYTTKFFAPFGNLIDSINGVTADANSQYWMLCVNGQFSSCGMDTYRLMKGDKINWKLVPFSRSTC